MTDRQPTQVLANGAIRYGIYNADGTLDHYEYLRREDAPTVEGTPLSKANLLSDATASKLWPAATSRRTQLSTRHLKSYRRACTSSAISS